MKHTVSARENSNSSYPFLTSMNTPLTAGSSFAVCVNNDGYPAALETGKIYQVLVDESAESHGYLRVVDESGEDYAYSKDRFFPLAIPKALEQVLFHAA